MNVELLCIADCPNAEKAAHHTRAAILALGLDHVSFTVEMLLTSADAARWPFAGSPTILIDGVDAFPSQGRTTDLACRIYPAETGFAGVPSEQQLRDVLLEHAS